MERLRRLGLPRASLVAGLVISTGVFTYMSAEGHRGEVLGALLLQALLIAFVQQGIDARERRLFLAAATALGLLALGLGAVVAALLD